MKQWMTLALAVMMLVTAVPMGNVEAKAKKLSKKDFEITRDGKKDNFLTLSKEFEASHWYFYKITDTKNSKYVKEGNFKNVKTKRNVKMGSTETAVMKQYGKAKKKKVSKTEKCFKQIKYGQPAVDTSAWKNYLEYTYKQGKDNYKIRFYLNKKNKVTAIVYIKNLNKFYNYPNKEVDAGLRFKAPSGKKITTKTIGGKKVYIIPKGTKIYYDKKYEDQKKDCTFYCCQYDVYGEVKAMSGGEENPPSSGKIEGMIEDYCAIRDLKKGGWKMNSKNELQKLNINKLGKYRYFMMEFYSWSGELAPQIIYFRYK